MIPTITTERLRLVPPSLRHWEAHAAAWADPRLTEYIGGKPRPRHESWSKYLQGAGFWELLGYGYWVFEDRESFRYLGSGGLAQFERGISELVGFPEAGWALVPDAWGKGLATEAIMAILQWADRALDHAEIRCIIHPGNAPSHRVAIKLGFEKFAGSHDIIGPLDLYRRRQSRE